MLGHRDVGFTESPRRSASNSDRGTRGASGGHWGVSRSFSRYRSSPVNGACPASACHSATQKEY